MKAPVCSGGVYTLLRLGLLGLIFICVAYSPAKAQSCVGPNCTVVYSGTTADALCFTNSSGSCASSTATITFGQTIDFFEPPGYPFLTLTPQRPVAVSGSRAQQTGTFVSRTLLVVIAAPWETTISVPPPTIT